MVNATQRMLDAHPTAEVWVTGHSLGGALAALCALDLQLQLLHNASSVLPKDVKLLTLGQVGGVGLVGGGGGGAGASQLCFGCWLACEGRARCWQRWAD